METKVIKILKETGNTVGIYYNKMFIDNTEAEFEDLGIKSPIEQTLYCALKCLSNINSIKDADPFEVCGQYYIHGLDIEPQKEISNYRVDFLVSMNQIRKGEQWTKSVIIECDSQEWHERSERQRRYEKKRDRFLALEGYTVFHFTGKEIMDKPYQVAKEIISYVTEINPDMLDGIPDYK